MASNLKKFTMALVGVLAFFLFNNTVYAEEYTITPDTTQEEINNILANATPQDNITIASGDYSTTKNGKNYHKVITVDKNDLNFSIAGVITQNYNLLFVVTILKSLQIRQRLLETLVQKVTQQQHYL